MPAGANRTLGTGWVSGQCWPHAHEKLDPDNAHFVFGSSGQA
jgi:hypothetical protein